MELKKYILELSELELEHAKLYFPNSNPTLYSDVVVEEIVSEPVLDPSPIDLNSELVDHTPVEVEPVNSDSLEEVNAQLFAENAALRDELEKYKKYDKLIDATYDLICEGNEELSKELNDLREYKQKVKSLIE